MRELEKENAELKSAFKCFKCGDGSTPLYCLNCANEELRHQLSQAQAACGCFIGLLQKCIDQVLSETTSYISENRAAWLWRDIDAELNRNPHGQGWISPDEANRLKTEILTAK